MLPSHRIDGPADAPVLETMRRELRGFGWGVDDFRRFVADIGWYELTPRLPAERIHLFAASEDLFFVPNLVEEMRQRWGQPDDVARVIRTMAAGLLPYTVAQDVRVDGGLLMQRF